MKQKYNNCTFVQQEMANFIDTQSWDYYCTFTTSYEQTMKSARRSMVRFHERANQTAPTTMFFACEPYDVKDGYHVHALVKSDLGWKSMFECYQVTSGGKKLKQNQRAQISKYEVGMGGALYCAKYISKKLSDWDILLPNVNIADNVLFR